MSQGVFMTITNKIQWLLTDPPMLADYSLEAWEHLPRDEVDALQLAGLKQRFTQLRDAIPMLSKLANAEGVDSIDSFDDVIPLLFDHTMYKSYPPSLLENNRFQQINKWLAKLTLHPVEDVDVSHCQSIDEWLQVMDAALPELRISHSTGTSGTVSFLPHSQSEIDKSGAMKQMSVWNLGGPLRGERPELHVAYPFFRSGYSAHLRGNEGVVNHLLRGEEYFHAAYPAKISSDVLYLSARIKGAQAKGTLDRLKVSPAILARKEEHDAIQAKMPAHLKQFFEHISQELRGKRIYVWATWNLLHNMAKAGLEAGLQGVFAADSYVSTGGGAKGLVQPPGWREDILRFTGARQLHELYAMSEVLTTHMRCEHGHYHLSHLAIPFQLNPQTSQPLPRHGRVTGRAAFFDLGADSRWGGFISGDEITIEWDQPCTCGRTSRYIVGEVQRYSEKNGGDDKITCAGTESAHQEAMDFLNNLGE
ncbi:hypothetical protein [Pseudomonas sp. PDM31]|uniref:hypothetical protein n=1 Tax=Pseudomonas sp. PDM31 TaxID=2854778 RepID=UPI0035290607